MYLSTLDTLFDTHFRGVLPKQSQTSERIKENDMGTGIILEVPGVSAQDLKITVKNRVLEALVSSKNDWGEELQWKRRFRLNMEHDASNIKAQLRDGVLKLFIPKLKESNEEIKVALDQSEENIFQALIA